MALDSDDIKKLDQHIVEPLLQAVEALGDRIDGLGDRIDGLGLSIETFGERIERSNGELAAQIVKSNEELRERTTRDVERVIRINEELLELLRQAQLEKGKKPH